VIYSSNYQEFQKLQNNQPAAVSKGAAASLYRSITMTNRKNWKCALSVGPAAMCDAEFEKLAEAGIEELELSSGQADPYFSVLEYPKKAKLYSESAEKAGVKISSVHLPFAPFAEIDPAALDGETRNKLIDVQSLLIKAAADAGIGIAVIHPSGEPYEESERSERLRIACDTISKLTDTAIEAGMTLALENLPRTCLCRSSDEMKYFLENIPDLRVCFDTNHNLREDNADFIRVVGNKIVTLHVSDYDFVDEKHWLPGKGKNDWAGILSALEDVDYSGRFLYECGGAVKEYREIRENYNWLLG